MSDSSDPNATPLPPHLTASAGLLMGGADEPTDPGEEDAGGEQRFGCIDVADTNHVVSIHEKALHCDPATT